MATESSSILHPTHAVLVTLEKDGDGWRPLSRDPLSPLLRADDVGVLRGDGVFERFLVAEGKPCQLNHHLERMSRSASMVDLEIPGPGAWESAAELAISERGTSGQWEMRLVATRGPECGGTPTCFVLGQDLSPSLIRQRSEGLAVITLARYQSAFTGQEAPWLLLGAKTLSYAVNMAAKRWVEAQGAQDAIWVCDDGSVLEGSTSAVLIAKGRELVSPPASIGILESISLADVLGAAEDAGWKTSRRSLSVRDLHEADGVWLTSSLRFARVNTLDGVELRRSPYEEEIADFASPMSTV